MKYFCPLENVGKIEGRKRSNIDTTKTTTINGWEISEDGIYAGKHEIINNDLIFTPSALGITTKNWGIDKNGDSTFRIAKITRSIQTRQLCLYSDLDFDKDPLILGATDDSYIINKQKFKTPQYNYILPNSSGTILLDSLKAQEIDLTGLTFSSITSLYNSLKKEITGISYWGYTKPGATQDNILKQIKDPFSCVTNSSYSRELNFYYNNEITILIVCKLFNSTNTNPIIQHYGLLGPDGWSGWYGRPFIESITIGKEKDNNTLYQLVNDTNSSGNSYNKITNFYLPIRFSGKTSADGPQYNVTRAKMYTTIPIGNVIDTKGVATWSVLYIDQTQIYIARANTTKELTGWYYMPITDTTFTFNFSKE